MSTKLAKRGAEGIQIRTTLWSRILSAYKAIVYWLSHSKCDECEEMSAESLRFHWYNKRGIDGRVCPSCYKTLEQRMRDGIEADELKKAVAEERRRVIARSIVEAETEGKYRT